MNCKVFITVLFSGRICIVFFHKFLIEIASDDISTWSFLHEEVLKTEFYLYNSYGTIQVVFPWVSSGSLYLSMNLKMCCLIFKYWWFFQNSFFFLLLTQFCCLQKTPFGDNVNYFAFLKFASRSIVLSKCSKYTEKFGFCWYWVECSVNINNVKLTPVLFRFSISLLSACSFDY